MTHEEAIKQLSNVTIYHQGKCTREAIDMAIDALEKQIPMKPIKSYGSAIRYCEVWKCPNCGFRWSGGVVDFCYRCSQAIDWSEYK